jgi:hypothetical protein
MLGLHSVLTLTRSIGVFVTACLLSAVAWEQPSTSSAWSCALCSPPRPAQHLRLLMQTAAALAACLGASRREAPPQSQLTSHPTRMLSLLLGPCEHSCHVISKYDMVTPMAFEVFDPSGPKQGRISSVVGLVTVLDALMPAGCHVLSVVEP